MGLPTVTKTWQFSINNTRFWNGDVWDRRWVPWTIKNWLVTNGWTVRRSSNSSTVANSDLWASLGNLAYNYGYNGNSSYPRSWIVLRAPSALGSAYDLFLACSSPNGGGSSGCGDLLIKVCQAGYNLDGNTYTHPTAVGTDQYLCRYGSSDGGNHGGRYGVGRYDWGYTYRLHMMCTSDQKQFRIVICCNGYAQGIWIFERLDTVEAPTVWTEPVIANIAAIGNINTSDNQGASNNDPFIAGSTQYSSAWQAGWCKSNIGRALINGQAVGIYFSSEYIASDPMAVQYGVRNELTNTWPMYPVGVAVGDSGRRGHQGMMTDMWMGAAGISNHNAGNSWWGVLDGETYPSDGSRKFVQFGNLIMPWTGSAASPVSTPCYVY